MLHSAKKASQHEPTRQEKYILSLLAKGVKPPKQSMKSTKKVLRYRSPTVRRALLLEDLNSDVLCKISKEPPVIESMLVTPLRAFHSTSASHVIQSNAPKLVAKLLFLIQAPFIANRMYR